MPRQARHLYCFALPRASPRHSLSCCGAVRAATPQDEVRKLARVRRMASARTDVWHGCLLRRGKRNSAHIGREILTRVAASARKISCCVLASCQRTADSSALRSKLVLAVVRSLGARRLGFWGSVEYGARQSQQTALGRRAEQPQKNLGETVHRRQKPWPNRPQPPGSAAKAHAGPAGHRGLG